MKKEDIKTLLWIIPVLTIVCCLWFLFGYRTAQKRSTYVSPVVIQHQRNRLDTTNRSYHYAWPGDTLTIYNCNP